MIYSGNNEHLINKGKGRNGRWYVDTFCRLVKTTKTGVSSAFYPSQGLEKFYESTSHCRSEVGKFLFVYPCSPPCSPPCSLRLLTHLSCSVCSARLVLGLVSALHHSVASLIGQQQRCPIVIICPSHVPLTPRMFSPRTAPFSHLPYISLDFQRHISLQPPRPSI